ncbi:hypothetical protein [Methylophilus sp.]|uniref:hypothetical protein n=1 Tax=Methylophilus sp. TaxID=29541 RepID=UPI0011D5332A|nr:hypothetical protein [Methylophilus sp.]TXI43254.1 MAG: hypothetical protein E6Q52_12970 [Methylophilus sp.]
MVSESKPSTRPLLWLILLLTLGLVYWQWSQEEIATETNVEVAKPRVSRPEPSVVAAAMPQAPDSQPAAALATASDSVATTPAREETYFTRQLPAAKISHVLFAAHEWLPPPPKPQPPPPPEAPPLPYTYVGSMQDVPGGDAVILMQQKKMLLPKLGSNVTTQWRVDREDMQAVYFTYLPLNKTVVLSKTKTAAGQRQAMADADNNPQEEMLNQ